jgi:Ca-activated chloride channel family protein
MKRTFLLLMVMVITLALNQPTKTIKGIVTADYNGAGLSGVTLIEKGTNNRTVTDSNGEFQIALKFEIATLTFSYPGFETKEIKVGSKTWIYVKMVSTPIEVDVPEEEEDLLEITETSYSKRRWDRADKMQDNLASPMMHQGSGNHQYQYSGYNDTQSQDWNTENYSTIHENIFLKPTMNPLSTFSIDVDAASYSNIRRFINNGQNPPKDAVRIEEMVNYFDYEYDQPDGEDPFEIFTELSYAPWNKKHKLLKIGLQGKDIPKENLPPSNLVFLLDVSGSMSDYNKLPLLKSSFKLLVNELRPEDRVAIVVYAGAAGIVLPSTPGNQKETIMGSLDRLQAGGSTAGGAGIKLAYKIAKDYFIEGGNNRVILATDGDFNIGESSDAGMQRLIELKRNEGVFLTVLGFGMGNYKDSKMEILADKGNGNYAYIDSMNEAEKVLKNEFGGTLFTIAKDVKIQVEFNPVNVQGYRLLGYENRALKAEDFNNDKKDAGELGSGHTVTALYEIIPTGEEDNDLLYSVDELRYQSNIEKKPVRKSTEIAQVKLRYKQPDGDKSKLLVRTVADKPIAWDRTSNNFRWASSVAALGMILRDSEFKGTATCDDVVSWAQGARGKDSHGYRIEFIKMAQTCSVLARN